MGTDIDEWRNSRPVRPDSCQNQGPSEARHDHGCLLPLEEWFKEKSLLVLIVGLAASLLQVWTFFKYTLSIFFEYLNREKAANNLIGVCFFLPK